MKIKIFFKKLLVLIIIFLLLIISFKKNHSFKDWFNKNVLDKNIPFYLIKNKYNKLFGSIIPFDKFDIIEPVINEKIVYKTISKYKDGVKLVVEENYIVPAIVSGIVTFIGDMDEYKDVIIIESEEVNTIYSNINSNIKLYDEVKKGTYIGEAKGNELYLVFKKDGTIIDYKKYI